MNPIRNGRFTSSEIWRLMKNDRSGKGFGVPARSYIEEKNIERKLGRTIGNDSNAKPLLWGKLVEGHVFELLGTEYSLVSQETIPHPTIEYWAGSPDAIKYVNAKAETVCDIKSPVTLKSFCQLVDYWQKGGMEEIRAEHPDGEKYYWQLVSNSCITGCKYAELIVYAPYREALESIRKACEGQPNYYKIFYSEDSELPWLPEGGHYKNLNVFRFEVPFLDKQALHERVEEAGKYLIQSPNLVTA